MKKLLVIIVSYNGKKWLDRCLSSVYENADVFVFDNDSTDGSADFVQAHFPKVRLVRGADNLGFTGANNIGFDYAVKKGYDYVYLLNQDAWLEEGALEKLLSAAESHPEYAVLSPLQMTDGYKDFDYQFGKWYRKASPNAMDGDVIPLPFIMAAHWLVPVEALKKIGFFAELFPFYGQDDDWCNRARYHDYKIGVVKDARAVHDRARRREAKEKIIDRNYRVGSLVRLCDINRPLWERFLFVCVFTLVKAVKYFSFLPFKHFVWLCKHLKEIKLHRKSNC